MSEHEISKAIWIDGKLIVPHPITNLPYNPSLKSRAKALRYARNLPEVLFWMQVHKKKFHALDFDKATRNRKLYRGFLL